MTLTYLHEEPCVDPGDAPRSLGTHLPYTLPLEGYTLNPEPYTLHPTPYTPHPTPYTLNPTPYTLHTASERRAINLKRFTDFYLKAEARRWF